MTSLDAAALGTFGARDRRLLRAVLRACASRCRAEDDDAAAAARTRTNRSSRWACRCRAPLATAGRRRGGAPRAVVARSGAAAAHAAARGICAAAARRRSLPAAARARFPIRRRCSGSRGDAAHLLEPGDRDRRLARGDAARPRDGAAPRARSRGRRASSLCPGLARGIDSAAHAAALAAGGTTVARARVRPRSHLPARAPRRWRATSSSAGAVVSEFPPGVPPLPHHFPAAEPHHQRPVARGRRRRGAGEERRAHHRVRRR